MKITLASILPRRFRIKSDPAETLFADYSARITRYIPCDSPVFDSEAEFLNSLSRQTGRMAAYAVLLDSRGKQLSSEELAEHVGRWRDGGTQRLVFASGQRMVGRLRLASVRTCCCRSATSLCRISLRGLFWRSRCIAR